jgi:hypothetical protein
MALRRHLGHDPEKWVPVFQKDQCSIKKTYSAMAIQHEPIAR